MTRKTGKCPPLPQAVEAAQPGFDGNPTVIREVKLLDPEDRRKRKVVVEMRLDQLAWLHDHGNIEQIHFDAGRKLQDIYERITVSGGSLSYEGSRSGSFTGLSDSTCDALTAFRKAWQVVPKRARAAVWGVVLERKSFNAIAALSRMDRRRVCEQLLFGLDALAIHFKFTAASTLTGVGSR